jgi:hypothetical protein
MESLEDRRLLTAVHNAVLPVDVNASGFVSIADLVPVVLELRAQIAGSSEQPGESEAPAGHYLDVTNDGQVSQFDMQRVISSLRAGLGVAAPGMEAEQTAPAVIAGRIATEVELETHLVARLGEGPWVKVAVDEEGVFSFDPREGQPGLPAGQHAVRLIAQTEGGAPAEMEVIFHIDGGEGETSAAAHADAVFALLGECGEG